MNFLPTFLNWQFAAAGLAFATGPIIIHLLNRRRYRVVPWAAMDFLREAIERSRKILHLRDLILLILRTAAVLLFGLALAQPYFASRQADFRGDQPVHAILLIDNSLSMEYQLVEGTLLDLAKHQAAQVINQLPDGSLISIVPLCGSRFPFSADPYRVVEHAQEALERIEVTDRSMNASRALSEARRICESTPELSKRIILFSDHQQANWHGFDAGRAGLDNYSVQLVDVGLSERSGTGRSGSTGDLENSWVADLRVQDGLADVETPATIIADVRHLGPSVRENVVVTLLVDGREVGSKTVSLESGEGVRQVTFEHTFDGVAPEPGQPIFVPVTVRLAPDRLPRDDERHLAVPVVASLPVVFVDQVAADDENPAKNRLGETRPLRTLLAPQRRSDDGSRQLVTVRHRQIDELDQRALSDARLVVIAGISSPLGSVPLLREYVAQGGQLFIAAGAEFDPTGWTNAAWQNGAGILPVPFRPEFFGEIPEETRGPLKPFFLSYDSMVTHDYFQIAGLSETDLRDLYSEPIFFKSVVADVDESTINSLRTTERQRIERQVAAARTATGESNELRRKQDNGTLTEAERNRMSELDSDESARPHWLLWGNHQNIDLPVDVRPNADKGTNVSNSDAKSTDLDDGKLVEQQLSRELPTVLARYSGDNPAPFLIERRIGPGRVVMMTSGLLSNWNTLTKSNAIVLLDRILRSMVLDTLPERNYPTQDQLALPIQSDIRDSQVVLQRPGESSWESLETGFVTRDRRGVTISHPVSRGIYRIAAFPRQAEGAANASDKQNIAQSTTLGERLWEMPVTINGPSDESDLTPAARGDVLKFTSGASAYAWVGPDETISLVGSHVRGQNMWWWLALLVLILLIAELAVILVSGWKLKQQ